MSTADIRATFISRKTGQVILEAALREPSPVVASGRSIIDRLSPFSKDSPLKRIVAPKPSSISYNTDITQFTDSFDFSIALAPGENFDIRSHDFVEFSIQKPDLSVHQIGAGYLGIVQVISNKEGVTIQANGSDFFGQLMKVPFKTRLQREPLTLNKFLNRVLKDSYLQEYLNLRHPDLNPVRDLGSFSREMLFVSDLEQKKGQILQKYAQLGINLVYMNRLGQFEILGRPGTQGSTAKPGLTFPVGTLQKGGSGANVDDMVVRQNFDTVFSEFTVFYSDGEANLDQQSVVSPAFQNSDPRVRGHIIQPGFTTFNSTDLVTIGGGISFSARVSELAKAELRKSNRDLNAVIVSSSDTGDIVNGNFVPFQVGQPWRLVSNEREFTSPQEPDGVDNVEMILSGISYQATESGTQSQLKFIERDALL